MGNQISQQDLYQRIKDLMADGLGHGPKLSFLLGAGMSYPLVPVTRAIVDWDLAWWQWCADSSNDACLKDYYDSAIKGQSRRRLAETLGEDRASEVLKRSKQLWQDVHAHQASCSHQPEYFDLKFELDEEGFPTDKTCSNAYQAAFHCLCTPAKMYDPKRAAQYFRDVVKRIGKRMNGANLFLASFLYEVQQSNLCGHIFTTNFDPLLQTAFQLVGLPYFVSDRPDVLGYPNDDGAENATHIIHAHGSVYRYLLLNGQEEIKKYASKNARFFTPHLQTHATIIVGYSGWDDTLLSALEQVDQFQRCLYWCDRGTSLESSNLSDKAKHLLAAKSNCYYVPIRDANDFFAGLYREVCGEALPKLIQYPIESIRARLEGCDLTDMKLANPRHKRPQQADLQGELEQFDAEEALRKVIDRLNEANRFFRGETLDQANVKEAGRDALIAEAEAKYLSFNYSEALPLYDRLLSDPKNLSTTEKALFTYRLGTAMASIGDLKGAIDCFDSVLNMPDAPSEQRAKSLYNKGVTLGQLGDLKGAIDCFDSVLNMPDAPSEQRAKSLYNKGVTLGQLGDFKGAIECCDSVLNMPDAPSDQRAWFLYSKGWALGKQEDLRGEIECYNSVLNMPDAPSEERARSLLNKGVALGKQGDIKGEIECYDSVLNMSDAPNDIKNDARHNRSLTTPAKKTKPSKKKTGSND